MSSKDWSSCKSESVDLRGRAGEVPNCTRPALPTAFLGGTGGTILIENILLFDPESSNKVNIGPDLRSSKLITIGR